MKRTPPSKRTAPSASAHIALLSARWAQGLSDELRRRVVAETIIRDVPAGGFVCRKGEAVSFDEKSAHLYLSQPQYEITIQLGRGKSSSEFLTCDLTAEYVHINADYTT